MEDDIEPDTPTEELGPDFDFTAEENQLAWALVETWRDSTIELPQATLMIILGAAITKGYSSMYYAAAKMLFEPCNLSFEQAEGKRNKQVQDFL